MNDYMKKLYTVKEMSVKFANSSIDTRNKALQNIADSLYKNQDKIFEANEIDLKNAISENLPKPIISRLKFNKDKLKDIIQGITDLILLDDPLNKIMLDRDLDEGLNLKRVSCPIGVIGVIFESRPDALVQIASLCVKSGNISILKGGSEAKNTNKILFETIYQAGIDANLPENFSVLLETRKTVDELLKLDEFVDLLIPRGSNAFVKYIMENSKIPVMGHSDGICHIYIEDLWNLQKTLDIILDSKTQYVSACNTVETLLVNRNIAKDFLPELYNMLKSHNVELRGCPETTEIINCNSANEMDFKTEYSDYIVSTKIVGNVTEAINHINKYGSHHTDCIVTGNNEKAQHFMNMVDSANVYQNCSTRFADGFRYGFGAEVGISTGKLHARGPVGLDGLITYKYKVTGSGHIVDDYASGKKHFHFKDK